VDSRPLKAGRRGPIATELSQKKSRTTRMFLDDPAASPQSACHGWSPSCYVA
jgi:hypothetical protein